MKRALNRTEMEALARTMEGLMERKAAPAEALKSLHANFHAEDGNGVIWTVGIHSHIWHRLEEGKWVQAYPPETLHLDENLAGELAKLSHAETVGACRQCGSALSPGTKFCPACGARAEAEPQPRRCAQCGKEVAMGKNFCSACGTRIA